LPVSCSSKDLSRSTRIAQNWTMNAPPTGYLVYFFLTMSKLRNVQYAVRDAHGPGVVHWSADPITHSYDSGGINVQRRRGSK